MDPTMRREFVIFYDNNPIIIVSGTATYHLPADILKAYAKKYAFDVKRLTWGFVDVLRIHDIMS